MAYYKNNKGLIATQNRDQRMAMESFLKSYSATINGCGGDKKFLELVLGKDEYKFLSEVGLTQFCYQKTKELYAEYPFPDDTPEYKKKKMAEDNLQEQGEEEKFKEKESLEEQQRSVPIVEE